jgi:peroxiredoxin
VSGHQRPDGAPGAGRESGSAGASGSEPTPRLGPLGLPRPPLWPGGQLARLVGLFAVAVAAVVVSFALVSHIGHPLLPGGAPAPPIRLADSQGARHDVLAERVGRPVVLEFFETTCSVCQREARPMCDVQRRHPDIPFFGLDAARESAAAVNGFRQQQGGGCTSWPLLLDPDSAVLRSYSVTVVPTVYLIGSGGRVAYTGTGEAGVAGLDQAITALRAHG